MHAISVNGQSRMVNLEIVAASVAHDMTQAEDEQNKTKQNQQLGRHQKQSNY